MTKRSHARADGHPECSENIPIGVPTEYIDQSTVAESAVDMTSSLCGGLFRLM